MRYAAFALAAAAAAGMASAQTKWVPLNSKEAKQAQGQAAPAPVVQPIAATPLLPVAPPTTGNAVLRTGTEIPLRLEEELTTEHKQLRVGQRIHLLDGVGGAERNPDGGSRLHIGQTDGA